MQSRELNAMNSEEITGFINDMERKLFEDRLNHASASLQDTDGLHVHAAGIIARAKTFWRKRGR